MKDHLRFPLRIALWLSAVMMVQPLLAQLPADCGRTVRAQVVAFDQVIVLNRLGAMQPQGMMYALRSDVVPVSGTELSPGNVRLRPGKRPRPLVLRMNEGDCLRVEFQNLLNPTPVDDEQPYTRTASVHVIGMQLADSIDSDGSNVGQNASSLAAPGQSKVYTLYAEREGGYLLYNAAAQTGGEGDSGSNSAGLFGAVIVEPPGAEWYRSQVTAEEREIGSGLIMPTGQPVLELDTVYPPGHPRAGVPIFKMLHNGEIIHSDLTAVITGPNKGRFPPGTFPPVAVEPDREQPFREFVTIYHDEIGAVQAFPQFNDPVLGHTLHSVRDAFAINYGTGGIGAEILANRFGVGPMADCTECKFEDFFLSSWAVGDPAMVVDVPANAPCTKSQIENNVSNCFTVAKKATKVLYPDDPSNVYHSYLRDHVKFRVLHAGSKEHHIHHQHTHQWLFTPDEDDSSYLDSQAIGPGSAFTLEMAYGGSGNRNLSVGDSIFHCHFYPHFAQGMWAMWRVHDVFEEGTPLDEDGRVAPGRALPDGEIAKGSPIPAIVPLPTLPMPPLPAGNLLIAQGQVQMVGPGHRGYPFFVPGVAGHRPPHPPLDTIDDGGLPRHVIEGGTFTEVHTRFDFSKALVTANAKELPETGTAAELEAMTYHSQRQHATYTPEGDPAFFITNGLPPQPGAPFADPCVTDGGEPTGIPRLYKSADIQLSDIRFNKAGWHFQQQRMSALWDDVAATKNGTRPPEPLFFRANSRDCIQFQLVNLIPGHYEQDDFQVRTPTDIVGQHIHLVKFDVLASDGAANGFNYEDGSFAPDDVIERIEAINAFGGLRQADGSRVTLEPEPHPFFGTLGAQTTVQRWYADDVKNNAGVDRTLRTVFTHDHFGPSTHQQVGLYAGLVVEPENSVWKDPTTGTPYGGRFDGGPTSWRADIVPQNNPAESYREFLLEFADFQHAYKPGAGYPSPTRAINPPGRKEIGLPYLLAKPNQCPGGVAPPCPEAVSADDVGTMVVNYRNEPLALRVRDPNTNTQAAGLAGDLSFGFRSDITRADAALNSQPTPLLTPGMQPGDPYTPLLEAYENDRVQIRLLVGAHEEGHNFTVHGVKWLFEPSAENSGFRNSQMMGISEHFEFVIPAIPTTSVVESADFLYTAGRATDDLWNGIWGIMRAYKGPKPLLNVLPNNLEGGSPVLANPSEFLGICPTSAPQRNFFVSAVRAKDSLPARAIVYNPRGGPGGPLEDPSGILYVRDDMLDANGKLLPNKPVEPLVLRANSGDCISLTLTNRLPAVVGEIQGYSALPMLVENFNTNQLASSAHVGLHPQLVYYDVTTSDGHNVGFNPTQTAAPGQNVTYKWYAGELNLDPTGILSATPIEFGSTNLMSSDPIRHAGKGGFGALIIEPQNSVWVEDGQALAVVENGQQQFYEAVLQFQTDVNLVYGRGSGEFPNPDEGQAVRLIDQTEDPEDSGHKAANYRSEQIWARMGDDPDTPLNVKRTIDYTDSLSDSMVGGPPHTPVFGIASGIQTRFRLLTAGGHARNNVFALHGHVWQQTPYINGSREIGNNPLSEWTGTFMGLGASSHFDAVFPRGGGKFMIPGEYLWRSQQSFFLDGGLWGILHVDP